MTVSTTGVSFSYIPGGAMAAQAIPFQAIRAADLRVTIPDGTVQVLGTDYEIIGGDVALRAGTASVRALHAYTAGLALTVTRTTALVQETQTPTNQPLPAETIERELDRGRMIDQEQDAEATALEARAIKLPVGSVAPPALAISIPADNGKVLAIVDGVIQPIPNSVSGAEQAEMDAIAAAGEAEAERILAETAKVNAEIASGASAGHEIVAGQHAAMALASKIDAGVSAMNAAQSFLNVLSANNIAPDEATGRAGVADGVKFVCISATGQSLELRQRVNAGSSTLLASVVNETLLAALNSRVPVDVDPLIIDGQTHYPVFVEFGGRVLVAINGATGRLWFEDSAHLWPLVDSLGDHGYQDWQVPSDFVVMMRDIGNRTLVGYDRRADAIQFGKPVFAMTVQALDLRAGTAYSFALRNHLPAWGQSLSSGDEVPGIVTTTTEFPGKQRTFGGARGLKPDLELANAGTSSPANPAAFTGEQDAVENIIKTCTSFSEAGETPLSGASGGWLRRMVRRGQFSASGLPVMWISAAGVGGNDIDALAKLNGTSNRYSRILNHMNSGKAIAGAESYKIPAFLYLGSEADVEQALVGAESQSAILTKLGTMHAALAADAMAITGQAEAPVLMMCQTSYRSASTGGNGGDIVARAQFEFQDHDTRFIACPEYFAGFDPVDRIHPLPLWQRILGEYCGKALDVVVAQHRKWTGTKPIAAWAEGTNVYVKYHVPVGPLAIDFDAFGVVTGAGFKITDSVGAKTVQTNGAGMPIVWLQAADTIGIKIDTACTGATSLRYALDHVRADRQFVPVALMGAGNIRDSDPDYVVIQGVRYGLPNWSQAYHIPVNILASGVI